jgi:precorrin-2/cobalt-factor-2 C20-methyltransferase
MTGGTLYALGLGPGDPDLMTVRAREVLERVPALFAPVRRAGGRSYVLDGVSHIIDTSRQHVEVLPFPPDGLGWHNPVERIVARLAAGDVAFLTEGDPLFYSTFIGVLTALRTSYPTVPVRIVPGVPSPMAAAAVAALPLADHEQRLAVLPAMHTLQMLPDVLRQFDTVVLLKVAPVLASLLDQLELAGLGERLVHVRRAGRPEQAVTLGCAAIRSAPPEITSDYFSLLIVHSAARGESHQSGVGLA